MKNRSENPVEICMQPGIERIPHCAHENLLLPGRPIRGRYVERNGHRIFSPPPPPKPPAQAARKFQVNSAKSWGEIFPHFFSHRARHCRPILPNNSHYSIPIFFGGGGGGRNTNVWKMVKTQQSLTVDSGKPTHLPAKKRLYKTRRNPSTPLLLALITPSGPTKRSLDCINAPRHRNPLPHTKHETVSCINRRRGGGGGAGIERKHRITSVSL